MLAGNTEGSTKLKKRHTNYYRESQQIKRYGFLYSEQTNG